MESERHMNATVHTKTVQFTSMQGTHVEQVTCQHYARSSIRSLHNLQNATIYIIRVKRSISVLNYYSIIKLALMLS